MNNKGFKTVQHNDIQRGKKGFKTRKIIFGCGTILHWQVILDAVEYY
ncbi:MAG: hypothetical protein R3Y58_11325 [Eubacteriales bacterium]